MEQQEGPSDAELVRRALDATTPERRKAAFTAIADRYLLAVFRQCARWFPHPEEAQDVCQSGFEAAFTLLAAGKGPERPDKLAGWLIEIARRRGLEYRRKDNAPAVGWALLPEGQSLEEIEDDEEPRSGSAKRRAHATRLVETVVATLTEHQRQIYQLRYVQELTGKQVAERLGIADKTGSNEILQVQSLIADGFGALILFQEGRRYCPDLASIIQSTALSFGAATFDAALRERIVRHFEDCRTCDDCRTCNAKRRELAGPYTPAVIPLLFAADLHDRIREMIDRITGQAGHSPPSQTGSGIPSAGGAGLAAGDTAGAVLLTARPGHDHHRGGRVRRTLGRRPAISALIAVIALAAIGIGAAELASGGGTSGSIPITATSGFAPDTGDVYVAYQSATDASAEIQGLISDPAGGEVVRLSAQQFPYTGAPVPAGSLTLNPGAGPAKYAFQVTPSLATRYQVRLFRDSTATTPLASSAITTIYVVVTKTISANTCGSGPICVLTVTLTTYMPPSVLKTEISKPWYTYFGINLSPSGSGEPPLPAWAQLGAGSPVVGKPQLIAANAFTVTISFTFSIGNNSYRIHWRTCSKDTETQDGFGLPGSHSCGDERIPASTSPYLG